MAVLSPLELIESLLLLTEEISLSKPLKSPPHQKNSASIVRKTNLFSILIEEILKSDLIPLLPLSAILCFKEILILLQRIKSLLENCSKTSKMWLLIQNESISISFHELHLDLSTLLDIFPITDLDLNEDVKEQIGLVKKQCRRSKLFVDPTDEKLRSEILNLIDEIEREIVPDPSNIADIFRKLGLDSSRSCGNEIKALEDEIHNQISEKSRATILALIGLIRYAKCILFGASTPRSYADGSSPAPELLFPADFRCPISLDLMRDPVIVSTGQTYDRASISRWIESGHATCPKTGQSLSHTDLVPNQALKSLIAKYCWEKNIPFEKTESNGKINGVSASKAAMEATRMTALFLVKKLTGDFPSTDAVNRVVHEIRLLAKTGSDNRALIAESGAVPLLIPLIGSKDPNLQINAVTALLNISILESNKKRIMETEGCLDAVIEVLSSGATWQARENAAATLLSLSALNVYRSQFAMMPRVIQGLVELARVGPASSKRDGLAGILNLTGDRESVGKLVEGGLVDVAMGAIEEDDVLELAVEILAMMAKRGGVIAVAGAEGVVRKMVRLLRNGSERVKECAAVTLVAVCRKGGKEVVAEFVGMAGIERVILELMTTGTPRARAKAAALGRVFRRCVMAREVDATVGFSMV
ncbi:U-box domain-containing protein 16-like [Tasmannia lanceolata]|uniref:U-box domain-containing protein 16-like n=1 Tax=Tasmannia lanceolata TaxID=3420 RepID=UPI004062AC9D